MQTRSTRLKLLHKFGLLAPGNYSSSTLYDKYGENNNTNSSKNVGSLNVYLATNNFNKTNIMTISIDFKFSFTSYKIKNNIEMLASNTTSK